LPLSVSTVRANSERIRAEVGPDVTVVAATKYVPLGELPVLAEAGIEVVGENRLQDLIAKQRLHEPLFRWHFIGHLQSRKARDVSALCELCHSLSSASAARRLTIPALVEVNLSGEESKSGVAPEALAGFLAEAGRFLRDSRTQVVYGTIRVVERDEESFLAWARQSYACIVFNLHCAHDPAHLQRVAAALRGLIDLAIGLGGSYYLTYHRYARRDQLLACYPQFPVFLARKLGHDPEERFQSDWYRHHRSAERFRGLTPGRPRSPAC